MGLVDDGWRRLDPDVVKTHLIQDLLRSGRYDDLLARRLADEQPIMPAELAPLVHVESLSLIQEIRVECLRRGENVIIEGTLVWAPAGVALLDELIRQDYQDVTIDVEVTRDLAHEQAQARWWSGRRERVSTGAGLGGRYTPRAAIDRAYPDPSERHSVCAANARALFDTDAARDIAVMTLTVHDSTSGRVVIDTHQRRVEDSLAPPFGTAE